MGCSGIKERGAKVRNHVSPAMPFGVRPFCHHFRFCAHALKVRSPSSILPSTIEYAMAEAGGQQVPTPVRFCMSAKIPVLYVKLQLEVMDFSTPAPLVDVSLYNLQDGFTTNTKIEKKN
jgi:hypothetical protein